MSRMNWLLTQAATLALALMAAGGAASAVVTPLLAALAWN